MTEIFITTGKKKDTVVCLAGVRSITTGKKKRYSRLSVGCAALAITTGKKKDTVVCLAGARSITTGKKKRYSCLSVGCAVLAITTGKKKIQSFVWRVVLYVVSVFGSDGKLAVFLL